MRELPIAEPFLQSPSSTKTAESSNLDLRSEFNESTPPKSHKINKSSMKVVDPESEPRRGVSSSEADDVAKFHAFLSLLSQPVGKV
jgi:hypothetical protein